MGMVEMIRGFLKRLNKDHVGAYAAQSAYFILLSFIPFVLLLVTLVKYTPLTQEIVTTALIRMVPEEFSSFIRVIVNEDEVRYLDMPRASIMEGIRMP